MSNIHLQTSFLPEGTHTHTSILKKTKIFCMQNRKVPPSLLPPAAQGGENHFLLQRWKRGFLENVMSCCQHLLFPRWGRNSDMQPGPKATTREDQSLSSCQILNRVVNLFILNKSPWHIIRHGFTFVTLYCGKLCSFSFSVLQIAFLKAFKRTWERKDQLIISEILLRAQSCKLLLN